MTRARHLALSGVTAVLCGGLLAACSDTPSADVAGSSWLVTDIWESPEDPSTLPDTVSGMARLAFGEQSLTGTTGCARLQGTVTFTREGAAASAENADTMRVNRLEVESPAEDCVALRVHEQLTGIITPGAVFDVRQGERSLVLTLDADTFDRPAIGLVAL